MIEDLIRQNEDLYGQIRKISDYRIAKDLLKLARSAENIREDISKEMVVCRRQQRVTQKLNELVKQYQEATETLSQNVTFALLLHG